MSDISKEKEIFDFQPTSYKEQKQVVYEGYLNFENNEFELLNVDEETGDIINGIAVKDVFNNFYKDNKYNHRIKVIVYFKPEI